MKKILMIGAGREVRGGITTVVDNYYALGIDRDCELRYLPTMKDGSFLKKLFIAAKSYLTFSRIVKKYDVVHVHMAAQASFSRKSLFIRKAYRKGVKVLLHSHAADFDKFYFEESGEKKQKKIREVFAMADRVVVLSREWAEFFGAHVCDPKKITMLYNGILPPATQKTDYADHKVLMLGRLGERKGTYDLINAIPGILAACPDAEFLLGGDGDIVGCRRLAEDLGVSDHVSFLGWVRGEDKERLFDTCSIFTLPSYHEGMPMAVLEAMGHGLATVSTNAGGIPQIITDGEDGYRIDAGDITALTQRIIRLLEDEELKRAIGRAGAETIKEKFNVQMSYQKLLEIYNQYEG